MKELYVRHEGNGMYAITIKNSDGTIDTKTASDVATLNEILRGIAMAEYTFECGECFAKIADDTEEVFSWTDGKNSTWLCRDCFEDFADDRWRSLSLREKAILLGEEVRYAGDFRYD